MTLALLITACCLVGSACFSGFENGMLAVRRARLDHALQQGSRRAKLMDRFLANPAVLLGTILLGNNLCNCFAAVYYDELLKGLFGGWMTSPRSTALVSLVGTAALTLVVLLFGEITPKVWFRQRPFNRSRIMVVPAYIFYLLTYPAVKALMWISESLSRLVSGSKKREGGDIALMREDFRMMLLESEETGQLDQEARVLLDNSLDFHLQQVQEIMTSREVVTLLSGDLSLEEAIAISQKTGISRFPVVASASSSHWIGLFAVYDALYNVTPSEWADAKVIDHIRPLVSVKGTAGINQVLVRSRTYQSPMLAVIDDHGQQIGIVTANDVIEPLFGELNA